MISFQLNTTEYAITNDQFATIMNIVALDWAVDYDIVEHDEPGMVTRYVYLYVHHVDDTPTRYHIGLDGSILMIEDVTWDRAS